jgi:UDP:flavonoid glycosyltransferase YjiC (YdhE family)
MFQGGGNIPLLMPVVTELARRGHTVHVLAGPGIRQSRLPVSGEFVKRLDASGASYRVLQAPEPNPLDVPSRMRGVLFGWMPSGLRQLAVNQALLTVWSSYWAKHVSGGLKQNPVDVLVADFFLFGAIAAGEAAGVATAVLVHNAFPPHAAGQPPKGFGFPPARTPGQHIRQRFWHWAHDRIWTRDGLPAHNRARAELGLQPVNSPLDEYATADRVLVLGWQAFDFPATRLPANVRYVGTPIDDRDLTTETWPNPWPAGDSRPLVLVSLSTLPQGQGRVMHSIVQALSTMPVRAIVTLGPLKHEDFSPPPNVVIETFVPHSAVLPHTTALITQCGLGGLTKALTHGVPLICIPLVGDQPDNAARVQFHRAGVTLSGSASVAQIRSAIDTVLSEPAYHNAARDLGARMGVSRGEEAAADELEKVARLRPYS